MVIGICAIQRPDVTLGDSTLPISDYVRSLSVTLDSTMTFSHHVINICKGAYTANITALRHICKYLAIDYAKTIAAALFRQQIGLLQLAASWHFWLSATNIRKLQRVQNSLARAVC